MPRKFFISSARAARAILSEDLPPPKRAKALRGTAAGRKRAAKPRKTKTRR